MNMTTPPKVDCERLHPELCARKYGIGYDSHASYRFVERSK
jgi:hypothetical protein